VIRNKKERRKVDEEVKTERVEGLVGRVKRGWWKNPNNVKGGRKNKTTTGPKNRVSKKTISMQGEHHDRGEKRRGFGRLAWA